MQFYIFEKVEWIHSILFIEFNEYDCYIHGSLNCLYIIHILKKDDNKALLINLHINNFLTKVIQLNLKKAKSL